MNVLIPERSILVVEDNSDLVIGLQDLLEHDGYHVAVAGTCAEALAQAHLQRFHTILLDLGLPDGDGMDVLRAFQSLDPLVPVVIITASTALDKTVGALSKGAFAYLTKPYNREELRAILRRAVGVKDLAAQAEHARSALTESEDRFRSLVESASDAIVVSDQQGYVISWNRAASALFGYEGPDIVGRPLTLLMPMRYREAHELGMERIRTTGLSRVIGHTVELHGLHRDGHEFPIELSLAAWKTQEGRFFSGIIRDISERKRAESALKDSQERLHLALRAGHLGTWDWHPTTDQLIWSENAEGLFHLTPGTLAPTFDAFLALVHVEDRALVSRRMHDAVRAKSDYAGEHRICWPDGTVRWVSCVGRPLSKDDPAQGDRMVGTIQCITKQKEAELALREGQLLLSQLTDHITDVFWMTDPEKHTMLYISPGYESLWGRSCASLKAAPRSWMDAIHPDDRERVLRDSLSKQVAGTYDVEYRIVRPDGTVRWIWDRAFPIRDEQGRVYRIAGLAEDVTSRRKTGSQFFTRHRQRRK